MRLGQLARKVSVHASEIIEFLGSKNITIEEPGNNARISDEAAKLVYERFAPELLVEPVAEVIEVVAAPLVVTTVPVEEEIKPESIQAGIPAVVDDVAEGEEKAEEILGEDVLPDVIKAPKVELKGLTVLGKIELPGAKKKEISAEETPVQDAPATDSAVSELTPPEAKSVPSVQLRPHAPARQKGNYRDNRNTPERPRKNPIALKREREAREEEERRKQEAVKEKEKRTLYYQNRVKPSVPTKAARIIDEPLYHSSEAPVRDQPKTVWGRFLRWLTT